MIMWGEMILDEIDKEYGGYSNPRMKLSRDVKAGKYIRLKRNLYETDPNAPKTALAQVIYGPSYISFDYALSFYGAIPEYARNVTCATFNKHKDKVFETEICNYYYTDVPKQVFPIGIEHRVLHGYSYFIASLEKALCDKFYKVGARSNMKEFEDLFFEDLRIDEGVIDDVDMGLVSELNGRYRCRNVSLFYDFLKARRGMA